MNGFTDRLCGTVATLFGLGRVGRMPGTLGSLVAAVVVMLSGEIHTIVIAIVAAVGTYAADRYARSMKSEDPDEVIIDEVVGMWISVVGLGPTYVIVAFFLFRVVDILKPFPINIMERLPGGIGIMADDAIGGLMTNIIIRLASMYFLGKMPL